MLKFSLLIIFAILSFTFASYGQACGRGIYTVSFVQKEPVEYELFSVTPKNEDFRSQEFRNELSNIFFPKEKVKEVNWSSMFTVKKKNAEKFLKNYNADNFEMIRDWKNATHFKFLGKTLNGEIKFETAELLRQPTLLKISSVKYGNFYFLGIFLGGCSRSETFDLSRKKLIH